MLPACCILKILQARTPLVMHLASALPAGIGADLAEAIMRVYITPLSLRAAYGTAIRGAPVGHSVTAMQHLHALYKTVQTGRCKDAPIYALQVLVLTWRRQFCRCTPPRFPCALPTRPP